VAYFSYVAVVGTIFGIGWRPWALLAAIGAVILVLAYGKSVWRDLAPLAYTLTAYREMNWFTPAIHDHRLEHAWIVWDRWLLDDFHLRGAIEAAGALLPGFFELCYMLVYAVAPVSVGLMFAYRHRDRMDRFWLAYLAGTLGAYALFPYFPSEPPRTVFANADLPHIVTVFRHVNLWIVGGYGIHSSVFPSAHVSSAFSAAWGLIVLMPERRWIGLTMTLYGICVAIATIYGRYHFATDALAGIAISLAALAILRQYADTAPY
jgi:membrane-associated phospholipid phosphatase